jgi:hypothetical protein
MINPNENKRKNDAKSEQKLPRPIGKFVKLDLEMTLD